MLMASPFELLILIFNRLLAKERAWSLAARIGVAEAGDFGQFVQPAVAHHKVRMVRNRGKPRVADSVRTLGRPAPGFRHRGDDRSHGHVRSQGSGLGHWQFPHPLVRIQGLSPSR